MGIYINSKGVTALWFWHSEILEKFQMFARNKAMRRPISAYLQTWFELRFTYSHVGPALLVQRTGQIPGASECGRAIVWLHVPLLPII